MPNRSRWLIALLLALVVTPARAADPEIALDVDASEAARKLIHVRVRVPVRAGTVALAYPKWIPGEHVAARRRGHVRGAGRSPGRS